MNDFSRRSLLSALLALAGTAAIPQRLGDTRRTGLAGELASWLGPEAEPIGRCYLQSYGSEANLDRLTDLLLERLRNKPCDDLQRELAEAVREDFGRGEVVQLEGWLLSRTEVRLCALAYLARHG